MKYQVTYTHRTNGRHETAIVEGRQALRQLLAEYNVPWSTFRPDYGRYSYRSDLTTWEPWAVAR